MAEKDKLDGLQTLLAEMPTAELFAYIRSIRQERKIPQHRIEAKKRTKRKNKDAITKLLEGINPEELAKILEGLSK